MRRNEWIQINLYPTTRAGAASLMVFENVGYEWNCKEHAHSDCPQCPRFKRRKLLTKSSARIEPHDSDVVETLIRVIAALEPDRCEVDSDGVHWLHAE